jgi:phosphoglycerol transferase
MLKRNKQTISKKRAFAKIAILVLLAFTALFFVTSRYKQAHFGDAQIDEILFYIMNGAVEGQSASLLEAAKDNFLLLGISFFILVLPVIDFYRNKITIKIDLSFIGRKKALEINPSRISIKFKLIYALALFILSFWFLLSSFGMFQYLHSLTQKSHIYEQYFVDPNKTTLTFPEKKKNLVYIYLESMENTVASHASGGQAKKSLIPELETLALDPNNTSFSNLPNGLGGALPATGTTWTVGGMVAQSSGLPLKTSILGQDHNAMGVYKQFLPGATTLGDILKKEGYNQTFIMGSESSFGGRDKLLSQHGNYLIKDLPYAKQHKLIDPDYGVWWGYEDKKLFSFAKDELSRLSKLNTPFNVQLLTADTHFTDGYLDPTCPTPYQNQYDNVWACSSKQVSDFISWIQSQPFAKDTVIIVSGDHLGMQTSYYDALTIDPNYQRTIYNVFINSNTTPTEPKQRLFSTFDMFPSTLAAMGVTIKGDRLGLGTNLFSSQPTLIEKYGSLNVLNDELGKYSEYYEKNIFRKTD